MPISEARSSSHAAPTLEDEYDVFLNFRGEDTRHNFTDFLYNHLVDAGVRVFKDEEELSIGEEIGDNLLRAINNCTLYIPIFSQTYASSKWCLCELVLMIDNVSNSGGHKSILPIFFNVEPGDLKLKTPLYEAAFREHEKKYPKKVKEWKKALAKVDETKGWKVKKDQSQAGIVRSVVIEVLEKLKIKRKLVTEHFMGLDDQVKEMTEFLNINHDDVRLIGIYGMGGIGKTTIAKVVFNQLCCHFGQYCSFLEGIRERSTMEGIVPLQKKLLRDIGGFGFVEKINDDEEGMRRIGAILSNKKVLVVLDDVDKKVHIRKLIGNSKLNRGCRIIITARDKDIMHVEGFEVKQHEMQMMDDSLAVRLFCRHAFLKDHPSSDYRELSREVVSLMGGLPLAIEVVGSLLKDKEDKKFWEETLVKLRRAPKEVIVKKLRISYDDLDELQKKFFLDIACFFFNEKKADPICMWESCEFCPTEAIEVLTNRCLIKVLEDETFWMHDQLIALGRQIVHEDSLGDFGRQSRFWIAEEALQIISTEERKPMIEALEISGPISNEDFKRLPNLRFLYLNRGTYVGDFARCHSNLRWFSWRFYPEKDFGVDNLYLNRLVVCKLSDVNFMDDSKAWDLIKRAQDLKVLSFTWCYRITTIPDISRCSALERLTLERCSNLKRIESFIGNLRSLIELKIEGCRNFTDLPEEVGALVKLKHFSLSRCSMLRELPGSIGNLTSLTELDLTDTKMRELPSTIGKLKLLRILRFPKESPVDWESHLRQFPSGIITLVNLEELDLSGHNEMRGEILVGIEELSSLRILNLESTGIFVIPRTINVLHHLQTLNLLDCHKIQELPKLPKSLTCLLLQSRSLLKVPNLSNLTNLVELQLGDVSWWIGNSKLIAECNLRWIGKLSKLKRLNLNLLNVPGPPELASLSLLEELVLRGLHLGPLMQLPSSNWSLRNLLTLEIGHCEVEDIPLEGLPQLEKLTVDHCTQLNRLSIPLELRKLRQVHVSECSKLDEIRVVGLSKSLEILKIGHCELLTRLSGLSYLKNLEVLSIKGCNLLNTIEGLDELESLKYLDVWKYPPLTKLINASCTKIPNDCEIHIMDCGDPTIDMIWRNLVEPDKDERQELHPYTSNKMEHPFTIDFILNIKLFGGVFSATRRKKKDVAPDSVTYKGLIAKVKGFGFLMKRMWYQTTDEDRQLFIEIKGDELVDEVVQLASERRSIHLIVEAGFDISSEGAMIWTALVFGTVSVLIFSFISAFFLFLKLLTGKLDFPRRIGQLAGMRRFSLCEDFVVIFVVHLILFLVKIWDEFCCDWDEPGHGHTNHFCFSFF